MAAFRADFYEALQVMLKVTDNPLLTDIFPVADPHNVGARILRHGIAVSAFAMLEQYVRSVFQQMVTDLAASSILYSGLPEKLRRFLVVDAVAGLNNSAYFIKDQQTKLTFMEAHVSSLAMFNANPPVYTPFGFSPSGSNIGHEDIKKGFAAFCVQDPWAKLTFLSSSIGASYLSLENEYKALANVRHSSAHDPAGNVPTTTLQGNLRSAIAIGIAVDLLGGAVGHTAKICSDGSQLESQMNSLRHRIRFVDEQLDGRWGERTTAGGRIIKLYPNRNAGIAAVKARTGGPSVILRDPSALPIALT